MPHYVLTFTSWPFFIVQKPSLILNDLSLICFCCLGFDHIHVQTYVEMGPIGSFYKGFDELYPKLQSSGEQYTYQVKNGFFSTAIIGNDKMAVLEVIHRLALTTPPIA